MSANRGFAGRNNTGYPHAYGDYIIALDNDTEAELIWIDALIRVAQKRDHEKHISYLYRCGEYGCQPITPEKRCHGT